MIITRKKTRVVSIGERKIGGDNPILIQSMTNTDTRDIDATVEQIAKLTDAGCEMIRCAVPDQEAAEALGEIKKRIHIPLVADIHFDYRLALMALDNGIDKLRINPGNIGGIDKIHQVVIKAKERDIPIRIGVNGGSLEKDILKKYHKPTAEALVESAEKHMAYLIDNGFENLVVSLKSSDVLTTIDAYSLFSKKYDYPLHLGVTEAGILKSAAVKSAEGLGFLLLNGIGDTLRVSITGNPLEEIVVGKEILKSIGLYDHHEPMVEIISCPTCGRTEIDLIGIAEEMNQRLAHVKKDLKVAVMGCVVNGPGEGREADIGVAGGHGKGVLFKKGKIFKTVKESEIIDALIEEINRMS
ncbi:MAG: flavodoxin-dependent (E)-4-hydroxy-3-methylbut-2-enyl-diphosphate synthase [Eubacteriaceae bacterium]|nr:flavodoxin-dependent (E)-4-hydroxy-3-methylbut-2-enyl-diphosphate synthase [Eubacteriaceae bacterium]MDD4507467.1 flavodoxin-dependent (E)-4-hydroxy-3-methylbut-2-enyl-diphosphate synthase [Eubacteriaceae bacterium]